MPRIVHLSDLHFGAHEPRLVEAVEERIDEEKPDLVVPEIEAIATDASAVRNTHWPIAVRTPICATRSARRPNSSAPPRR